MMSERGITLAHTTILCWAQRYVPEFEKSWNRYARPRKFQEKLDGWLGLVRAMWPACPASIDAGGTGLLLDHASTVLRLGESDARNW